MRSIPELLAAFNAFPSTDINTLLAGRRPLILAPHADDESLGAGGLIAAACAAGLAPAVVILTDGAASHPGSQTFPPSRLRTLRETEARQAVAILGLARDNLFFLRQPDSKLASSLAVTSKLQQILAAKQCRVIIGPWHGDPHCDHESCARIAADLAALAGCELLSYPVWGWLRDAGDVVDEPRTSGWRLDIHAQLSAKQRAIAAHASQYSGLIADSPGGFQLPENLLAIFNRPFEVFIA